MWTTKHVIQNQTKYVSPTTPPHPVSARTAWSGSVGIRVLLDFALYFRLWISNASSAIIKAFGVDYAYRPPVGPDWLWYFAWCCVLCVRLPKLRKRAGHGPDRLGLAGGGTGEGGGEGMGSSKRGYTQSLFEDLFCSRTNSGQHSQCRTRPFTFSVAWFSKMARLHLSHRSRPPGVFNPLTRIRDLATMMPLPR